jgi:hypothetical protein
LHSGIIKKESIATNGRPNTQLPFGVLTRDVILCCGEDLEEFKQAVVKAFGAIRRIHGYRCYSFFRTRDAQTSFVWTGIGTGCLEPLLCEIASEPWLERIILVGTAGAVTNRTRLGAATLIRDARLACAGVSPKSRSALLPNWPMAEGTASIVSTDYYYGFTLNKEWPARKLWAADSRLAVAVAKALRRADLVDMETGQFYHLCRVLRPDLQFIAIKGATNPLADFSQQVAHSESVLCDAVRKAKGLLAKTSTQ